MKYTAEEVRAMASDLRGAPGTSMIGTHISLPTARAVAIYEALCAYAERIAADKGVVTCSAEYGSLVHQLYCEIACNGESGCFFALPKVTQERWISGVENVLGHPPAQAAQHPDDVAVDAFAEAMKAKLAEARAKGRGGWQDKDDCPQQRLSDMLRAHVEKGDPRDVANFCMFLHQRGEAILQGEPVAQGESARR